MPPAAPISYPPQPGVGSVTAGGAGTSAGYSGPSSIPPAVGHGSIAGVSQPLTAGYDPNASGSKQRKSRKPLIAVGALVVAAVVAITVVALSRGGDPASAAQPTRQQLEEALIPIRDVRDALGNDFNAQESGDGEPFCEQFSLEEPTRLRDALYYQNETIDGVFTATTFSERLASYPTEQGAQAAFDQDKAISTNCSEQKSTFDGVPVTYKITNATRSVSKVGDDVISVKFVAEPDDGSESVITGYVIVRKVGNLIMSTNYEVYRRELTDDEFDNYLDLTAKAFARVDEML